MPPLPAARLVATLALALALVDAGAGAALAQERGTTGNVNLFVGVKALDENDWAPADSQAEIGVEVDVRQRSWPVSLVVGLRGGHDETDFFDPGFGAATFESRTSELAFGVKKIWEPRGSPLRPFLGGGLVVATAEATLRDAFGEVSDRDRAFGLWIGGGLYVTLAEHLNLGLDLRVSSAEVELFGIDAEAGGTHLGLVAGYHW